MKRTLARVAAAGASMGLLLASASSALASEADQLCKGANGFLNNGGKCASQSNLTTPLTSEIQQITNTLLIVAGAVAVIIIIISGIRYVTSTGDATRIKQSKDTLLYAVAGLIVVIAAYAIVHAVATRI